MSYSKIKGVKKLTFHAILYMLNRIEIGKKNIFSYCICKFLTFYIFVCSSLNKSLQLYIWLGKKKVISD